MIIIKSDDEIDLMRESGKVTAFILKELENIIKPGMSTEDIDSFVEETIRGRGMIPTFKGYGGFPASACVSVNEEVVHGIPDKKRILKEGDIVSVDVGSTYKGYVSDAARTYPVGQDKRYRAEAHRRYEGKLFRGNRILQGGMPAVRHLPCRSGEGRKRRIFRNKGFCRSRRGTEHARGSADSQLRQAGKRTQACQRAWSSP